MFKKLVFLFSIIVLGCYTSEKENLKNIDKKVEEVSMKPKKMFRLLEQNEDDLEEQLTMDENFNKIGLTDLDAPFFENDATRIPKIKNQKVVYEDSTFNKMKMYALKEMVMDENFTKIAITKNENIAYEDPNITEMHAPKEQFCTITNDPGEGTTPFMQNDAKCLTRILNMKFSTSAIKDLISVKTQDPNSRGVVLTLTHGSIQMFASIDFRFFVFSMELNKAEIMFCDPTTPMNFKYLLEKHFVYVEGDFRKFVPRKNAVQQIYADVSAAALKIEKKTEETSIMKMNRLRKKTKDNLKMMAMDENFTKMIPLTDLEELKRFPNDMTMVGRIPKIKNGEVVYEDPTVTEMLEEGIQKPIRFTFNCKKKQEETRSIYRVNLPAIFDDTNRAAKMTGPTSMVTTLRGKLNTHNAMNRLKIEAKNDDLD